MNIGHDAIGILIVGGGVAELNSWSPLVYEPVSRIIAGGFSNGRPVEVAITGPELNWDNDTEMGWDTLDTIGWEI